MQAMRMLGARLLEKVHRYTTGPWGPAMPWRLGMGRMSKRNSAS